MPLPGVLPSAPCSVFQLGTVRAAVPGALSQSLLWTPSSTFTGICCTPSEVQRDPFKTREVPRRWRTPGVSSFRNRPELIPMASHRKCIQSKLKERIGNCSSSPELSISPLVVETLSAPQPSPAFSLLQPRTQAQPGKPYEKPL